jgi:hypothetical protein
VRAIVQEDGKKRATRAATFKRVWNVAHEMADREIGRSRELSYAFVKQPIPFINERWY